MKLASRSDTAGMLRLLTTNQNILDLEKLVRNWCSTKLPHKAYSLLTMLLFGTGCLFASFVLTMSFRTYQSPEMMWLLETFTMC